MRLLRVKEVAERLSISRVTLWHWRRTRPDFPKAVQISNRILAWREDELNAWLEARRVKGGAA